MTSHVSGQHNLDDSASEEAELIWGEVLPQVIARPAQDLESCGQMHVLIHADVIVHQGSLVLGVDKEVIGNACRQYAITSSCSYTPFMPASCMQGSYSYD